MRLTKAEKKICAEYSARDAEGLVHCNSCPLRILYSPNDYGWCKATATRKEWRSWRSIERSPSRLFEVMVAGRDRK